MTRASDTARLLGAGATILDGTTITTADNTSQLILTSTDADSSFGGILEIARDSASPADGDAIGQIKFTADNDAGQSTLYGTINGTLRDASDGTEDGQMQFSTMVNGSTTDFIRYGVGGDGEIGLIFNEGSIDADFRVESNGNANMLFVDGGNDRVGINTNSPSANLTVQADSGTDFDPANANFNIATTIKNTTSGSSNCVSLCLVTETNGEVYLSSVQNSSNDAADMVFSTRASGTRGERMRITSAGELLVSTTSTFDATTSDNPSVSGASISAKAHFQNNGSAPMALRRNGSNGSILHFARGGAGTVGSVSITASSTAFNTSSDYRLKENISYDFDATTRLKQLKPARFNFIADKDITVDGFIAHEVSSIVPEAINGEKDAMAVETRYTEDDVETQGDNPTKSVGDIKTYSTTEINPQGIDQSKLVPLLVKTIQELEARITTLENA